MSTLISTQLGTAQLGLAQLGQYLKLDSPSPSPAPGMIVIDATQLDIQVLPNFYEMMKFVPAS